MLITLGISHKTAPIEVREKLAFSQDHIPMAIKTFASDLALEEVALLSTCNRTEFYCSVTQKHDNLAYAIQEWWQVNRALSFELDPFLYHYCGKDAVTHLMRVASGLDSMILGEPQILGQLKSAFGVANQSGLVGKYLSKLFQSCFSIAKKVRTNTGIANNPVSVAFAAVTLAKQIFTDLSKTTVILMGAGENSELTLQHLQSKNVKKIIIANRTLIHAQLLASKYNAQAIALTELPHSLAKADIVISAMGGSEPILTPDHLQFAFGGKRRPLLMIDLGVPRNIDPIVGDNEDIYLYSIDDLKGIISENVKSREKAAVEAHNLIDQASNSYMGWVGSQAIASEAIKSLRINAESIKNETLEKALKQLDMGHCPHTVLKRFAHLLTQKLLHEPTVEIKARATEYETVD